MPTQTAGEILLQMYKSNRIDKTSSFYRLNKHDANYAVKAVEYKYKTVNTVARNKNRARTPTESLMLKRGKKDV